VIDDAPPDELRELIAREGARMPAPALRVVVRAQLGASIAAAGVGGAATGLKVLLAVVLVGGAGAGVATFAHGRTAVASAPAPEIVMSVSEQVRVAEAHVATLPPVRQRQPQPQPLPQPLPLPLPLPQLPLAPPPSDAALLGAALRALSAKDAARALELVAQDAQLYPLSTLDEERDAIRIRALTATGQLDDARTLGAAFLAAHPHSIHRHLVEHLDAP
jgi:hypothetical protein